jgi:UDP-glucose 4-epimerase
MLKREKIVITGGAGFIGSALANELSKSYDVFAIDNLSAGSWGRLHEKVTKIELDLSTCSVSELKNLLYGTNYVCHLAAVKLHNVNNAAEMIINSNIKATNNVITAAGEAGVKRMLFTSSLYAYGSMGPRIMKESDVPAPMNVYGASKLIGEEMLRKASEIYGYSYVCPRLFFVYGPGQFAEGGYKSVIVKSCERILNGESAQVNGDGNQSLDYVYITDCVDALMRLLFSTTSGIFNVSTGQAASILQIVETISDFSEKGGFEHADKDWTAGSIRFGDNSRLISETGWDAKIPLEQGLRRTWEYYSREKVSLQ